MMNRIEQRFRKLRREKKKALVAFITAGDPNLGTTQKLAREFSRLGVDVLELGVPFSDPLADGPTIQAASQRALKNKIHLDNIFNLVRRLREKIELPIALLTYYNIIYRFGVEKFARLAAASGVDGVVVADLPTEEAKELIRAARKNKLATIFLLAPTSDESRIRRVAALASGFIYYVSLTGTTGTRKNLPKELSANVRRIKRLSAKAVCVGFGVSNARQAKQICRSADGVIVGSAIVKLIEKNLGRRDLVSRVSGFVQGLRQAI